MKFNHRTPLYALLLILCISSLKWTLLAQESDRYTRFSQTLISETAALTSPLKELLKVCNIDHDGTLSTIVPATQKAWLRPAGAERWESPDSLYDEQTQERLLQLCTQLKLFQTITPNKKHYHSALILGATAQSVRKRLAYCVDLHNQGVVFDNIIFLGSERQRNHDVESESILLQPAAQQLSLTLSPDWDKQLPKDEDEINRFIYTYSDLPESFKIIPVTFLKTPNTIKPDGSHARATTLDTIHTWLSTSPAAENVLFISHQPYVGYQDIAVQSALPEQIQAETVGIEADPQSTKISNLLDSLARSLYILHQQ